MYRQSTNDYITDLVKMKMNINRNESEHELDNLLREIDPDYIESIANSTCDFADILVQRIYDKNKNSK